MLSEELVIDKVLLLNLANWDNLVLSVCQLSNKMEHNYLSNNKSYSQNLTNKIAFQSEK